MVTCHVASGGGKCTCTSSVRVVRVVVGVVLLCVDVVVVVAESTYVHLSAYDDSLVTDDDDSWCGWLIRYAVPDEVIVTSVGDVS